MLKLLWAEDDASYINLLQFFIQSGDLEIVQYKTGTELLQNFDREANIVVVDYNLPDMNGLELLEKVKAIDEHLSIVMLSGQSSLDIAVKAYDLGAKRYIMKNESAGLELDKVIQDIRTELDLRLELLTLKEKVLDREKYSTLVGESVPLLEVLRLIQKVEKTDMQVLITGESGTGKELVANELHRNSARNKFPFVAVNVAAIPEELIESELFGHEKGAFTGAAGKRIGKFEQANKGTIFLDEIGEMNLGLQAKLLRVLQEKSIQRLGGNKEQRLDIRVVAATNRDLSKQVAQGTFREDLYYRLQGFLIHLPPLRERENDVILLANHFANLFCIKEKMLPKRLSKGTITQLLRHPWPGNVRELKAMIERAILVSDGEEVTPSDLIFSPYKAAV